MKSQVHGRKKTYENAIASLLSKHLKRGETYNSFILASYWRPSNTDPSGACPAMISNCKEK